MKRKIVKIDPEKCNGCRACVDACHEGAIIMKDGKAVLASDKYCDGLGDCLPGCPTGAIEVIEREAEAYSEEAVQELKKQKEEKPLPCGCPGTMARKIDRVENHAENHAACAEKVPVSELRQWPVQLKLVNPEADYLDGADLLVAADCTAYAYANFHRDFIKGRVVLVGCPKLDDNEYYRDKLTHILRQKDIRSITVVKMEVPCCGGIARSVKEAMLKAEKIVSYREVTVGVDGNLINNK